MTFVSEILFIAIYEIAIASQKTQHADVSGDRESTTFTWELHFPLVR
jgi:hypothetical protein